MTSMKCAHDKKHRTFQVPVIQLKNILEQVGGEQLQPSDTVVLDTREKTATK